MAHYVTPTLTSRTTMPKATDRLPLGQSGLQVSPICLGIVEDPAVVPAAFDAGVNFFFVSGDLHWPLYEGLRKGLELLFSRGPSVRDQVVVGAVSYLDQPIFQALQFHEIIQCVQGLQRVDVLLAGAVWSLENFQSRVAPMQQARQLSYLGSQGIGASFHDRNTALLSIQYGPLDVQFIRYNTAHPGAQKDMFPYFPQQKRSLTYNFKSMMSRVTPERFRELGLAERFWEPHPTDYYRFALNPAVMDGVLCSLYSVEQLNELLLALEKPPLTPEEEAYMLWLSSVGSMRIFE